MSFDRWRCASVNLSGLAPAGRFCIGILQCRGLELPSAPAVHKK
jgi:hypothetical protein